jgi:hypothetical protein
VIGADFRPPTRYARAACRARLIRGSTSRERWGDRRCRIPTLSSKTISAPRSMRSRAAEFDLDEPAVQAIARLPPPAGLTWNFANAVSEMIRARHYCYEARRRLAWAIELLEGRTFQGGSRNLDALIGALEIARRNIGANGRLPGCRFTWDRRRVSA